ncbi:MAG: hypothetical protein KC506_01525 [Nanoarchaeota archaeon]|nr:hypothetical protein [Nanoarchaeota archaeon]
MENWPLVFIFAGILLIGVASFGFSVPQASAPGQAMSDIEAFQVFMAALGLGSIVGGMYKR